MSFLFAELLCCKAIMFLSKKSVGVSKGPYVLPFCNVTVLKNCVILLVRSVEISKLLFLVFPLCYNYVANTFVDMKINSIDYKCRL